MFTADPATKKGKGRRQTRRILNGMDESETSKAQKRCSQLPWTLRWLHEDTWERYPGRVPTTATALVVREASRWSAQGQLRAFHGAMYADEEDERPTMGTIWI